jgi:shikimate 5-dehydrogenase
VKFHEEAHSLRLDLQSSGNPIPQKNTAQGTQTKNGQDMLIFQAEKAWKIWNKKCFVLKNLTRHLTAIFISTVSECIFRPHS